MKRTASITALLITFVQIGSASALDISHMQMPSNMKLNPDVIARLPRLPGALPMVVKGKGCTFYENANGSGASWHKEVSWQSSKEGNQVTYAEVVNYTGDWWNDKISSIRCDDSASLHCYTAIYPDANRGGQDAVIAGQQGLISLQGSRWDNSISSFAVFCTKIG
jgi:hypothetical protein